MQRPLLIATHNPGKLAEFRRLLATLPELRLYSFRDLEQRPHVVEDGESFGDNAAIKALAGAKLSGDLSLADDSGLEVDALGGAPGVRSARFAGERATDGENNHKLLQSLEEVLPDERQARFRCVLVLAGPEGEIHRTEGRCEGRITSGPRGRSGFGYDPLFVVQGGNRTMAELSDTEKNQLSHRGEATAKMVAFLREYLER